MIAAALAMVFGGVSVLFTAATVPIATVAVVSTVYLLAIHTYYPGTAQDNFPPDLDTFIPAMVAGFIGVVVLGLTYFLGLFGPIGVGVTVLALTIGNFLLFLAYKQDHRRYDISPTKWWLALTRLPTMAILTALIVDVVTPSSFILVAIGVLSVVVLYGIGRLLVDPDYSDSMREPKELERRYESGREHSRNLHSQINQINRSLDRVGSNRQVNTVAPGTTPDEDDLEEIEGQLADVMQELYASYPDEDRLQNTVMDTQQEIQEMYKEVYNR